ncbi:MAG: multidrug effflux MFS transporter [Ectothiorhodospiraceae bacterium]|jgi:DHA1 family bicyclomycin/chloramphenicol resistance-like MFS transporter
MLRLASWQATLVLAALVAMGPLATDLYLPALPAIARDLGAGADQVQLTLSVYLIGFAVAQLVYGPVADRFGRKPVLFFGISLFILASIGCAYTESIEAMIALRFLQALGGCAGPVLGRAAVRDIHTPLEAARVLSYLGTAMALAPAVAPTIGGFLLVAFGWPSAFVAMAIYAIIIGAILIIAIPEPLAPELRQSIHPFAILRNYSILLRSREFLGYTLTNAAVFAGLFAFLSGSSFVLIEFLGVPEAQFGFYFALIPVSYMTGTLIAGRLSRELGVNRLLVAGTSCTAGGGLLIAALAVAHVYHVAAVLGPMMLFMVGVGIVMPQTLAGAVGPFPHMAGSASALYGFTQMTTASLVGAGVGHFHEGTSLSMAAGIGAMGIASLALFFTLVWLPMRVQSNAAVAPGDDG